MRTVVFFGGFYSVLGIFLFGFHLGHMQEVDSQASALEGCELVASQVAKDIVEAEGKAAACEEIFRNLGALEAEGQEH